MGSAETTKRMDPAERRAHILDAARVVLARDGLERFSLEAVAREAGVAATLPRHYFASRDGLLVATAIEVIQDITSVLTVADPARGLADRLRAYIDELAENPWAHTVWLGAAHLNPELEAAVDRIHRRLAEISFGHRWEDMSRAEQLRASGWIGYANAAIAQWIEQGGTNRKALQEALLEGARSLGVNGL